MEQKKKYRFIAVLMLLSQALLTILVIQWLGSQYKSEKDRLYNELTDLYSEARDEIIDTMLFQSYVTPVLRGSEETSMQVCDSSTGHSMDTLTNKVILSGKKELKWSGADNVITVKLRAGVDSSVRMPDSIKLRGAQEDILLRSVRLIVAHAEDSAASGNQVTSIFSFNPDTAAFMERFQEKITGNGLKLSLAWPDSGKHLQSAVRKEILINPLTPFNLPAAVIEDFNWFLAGRMLPQILFSVLLVIISALAFVLSAKNIREQILVNDLKNEFIANITHELKTPVATLIVALESLLKYNLKDDPVRMKEYISLALKETGRLEELVTKVLDHTILENKENILDLRKFEINPIVKEAVDTMNLREGKNIIELTGLEEPYHAEGDPMYFRSVILNLLDNSIKHCDKEPEIKVSCTRENNMLLIRVKDNGPGIPEEYGDRVFDKFFRIPSSNVHNVKGYGLGLSFASSVVKVHKGTITYRNLDGGCEFIVKLPC
jgi:signal transduction histidine kinase